MRKLVPRPLSGILAAILLVGCGDPLAAPTTAGQQQRDATATSASTGSAAASVGRYPPPDPPAPPPAPPPPPKPWPAACQVGQELGHGEGCTVRERLFWVGRTLACLSEAICSFRDKPLVYDGFQAVAIAGTEKWRVEATD